MGSYVILCTILRCTQLSLVILMLLVNDGKIKINIMSSSFYCCKSSLVLCLCCVSRLEPLYPNLPRACCFYLIDSEKTQKRNHCWAKRNINPIAWNCNCVFKKEVRYLDPIRLLATCCFVERKRTSIKLLKAKRVSKKEVRFGLNE